MEAEHRTVMSPDRIRGLEARLGETVRGEVDFSAGARALYATDGSNYRQPPIGVVLPRDADDVIAVVAACREFGAPLLSRGAGTSLAGQCCNVAVVMDMSRYMNRIVSIDPERKQARVQPGVILDHLRDAAEEHHLTFAPDPATHTHNTLGGMIGNNSCGVHSVMGGRTVDNIIELDVLTYDGERLTVGATSEEALAAIIAAGGRRGAIYRDLKALRDTHAEAIRARYPDIPRRVSGFNLDELLPERGFHVARALVGTESTCVVVLEATLRLVDSPPHRVLLVLGYPDVYTAGDHVMEVLAHDPVGLEGMDERLVADMRAKGLQVDKLPLLPDGGGWLLVEFGGDSEAEATAKAEAVMAALRDQAAPPSMALYTEHEAQEKVWALRESGLGATAHVPNQRDTWPGWEDSAVPPERVGEYLRELRALLEKHGYACDLYGHFGQGCIHTRIDFDLETAAGIENYTRFAAEAADLVTGMGGSYSGEHGDGQARGALLPRMFGEALTGAFRDFKRIWDPEWKMNPGKVVDPYRLDENLRLGTDYHPPELKTFLSLPDDDGSFPNATLRCVGVGKCRRERHGTMCPSYQVTREEQHSTRGRARLLFEMVNGDVITHRWREQAVKEALDLCLSCKGCLGECPVNVDMATYKAEFMYHYFRTHPRPRSAHAFGHIDIWARLAATIPGAVNFVTQTPGLRGLAKLAAGIHPDRDLPTFAPESFTRGFRRRGLVNSGKPPVLLWPDTFNNHFQPEVAQAAVAVLEAAGFQVRIPQADLCCGRALYAEGMLPRAKRLLRKTLHALGADLRAGTPIVGLEPACLSVFKVELRQLFPNDEQAKRLASQSFLFGDFLARHARGFRPPPVTARRALLHGHCNQKSVMSMVPDRQWLERVGLEVTMPDTGCCGMAGSFGFERDKYEVSIAAGERVLLPAVRQADSGTLIVSDGYSCREQIAQGTGRKALHLAQVLQGAIAASNSPEEEST